MRERRDLYNQFGQKTDKTYYKGEKILDGYYPMVVMIVIQNTKGEFLMQKRVKSKGGDWGVTGGHPKSGETPLKGIISEAYEELGINLSKDPLIEYDSGWDGKECFKMYYVQKDLDLKTLNIQKEELEEVRWFSLEQLQQMVDQNELNEDQISCFQKVCKFLEEKNSNL